MTDIKGNWEELPQCGRCGHPKGIHAEYIDRTPSTMDDAPQRRACQHQDEAGNYDCSCYAFIDPPPMTCEGKDQDDPTLPVPRSTLEGVLQLCIAVANLKIRRDPKSLGSVIKLSSETWSAIGGLMPHHEGGGLTHYEELQLWREITELLPYYYEECNSPPWTQVEEYIKKLRGDLSLIRHLPLDLKKVVVATLSKPKKAAKKARSQKKAVKRVKKTTSKR